MSERQFTFNEKLAGGILCTALLAQKMCEELSTAINIYISESLYDRTMSGEVTESIRLRVLLWVSPYTSINNIALGSSFQKQTPSLMLVP